MDSLLLNSNHFAIPEPDLNIFLDVPFAFTEKNCQRPEPEMTAIILTEHMIFMKKALSFQKKVRDIYLRVAESDERLAVVDCSNNDGTMLPPEEIFDMIVKFL